MASAKSLPRTPGAPSGSLSSEWSLGIQFRLHGSRARARLLSSSSRSRARCLQVPTPRSWGDVGSPQDTTLGFALQDLRPEHPRPGPGAPRPPGLRGQSESSLSVRFPIQPRARGERPRSPANPGPAHGARQEAGGWGLGAVVRGQGSGPPRWGGRRGGRRGHLVFFGQGRARTGYKSCPRGHPGQLRGCPGTCPAARASRSGEGGGRIFGLKGSPSRAPAEEPKGPPPAPPPCPTSPATGRSSDRKTSRICSKCWVRRFSRAPGEERGGEGVFGGE